MSGDSAAALAAPVPPSRLASDITSLTLPSAQGTGAPPKRQLRRNLYRYLDSFRDHTRRPRVAKCGHVRCAEKVGLFVGQRGEDGHAAASFGGLIKCRSKSCPLCIARRRAQYAEEILRVAQLWTEDHKLPSTATYLATFTIRHGMGDRLEDIGIGVRQAWRRFVSSKAWQATRRRYGLQYVVAEELTYGDNGWHPHLHVLFLPEQRLSGAELLQLSDLFYERWADMVERERQLGPSNVPDPEHGTDLRPCASSDYISKTVGLELADPGSKRGKRGGRSPIRLLQRWADEDCEESLARYQEYERVMHGRRDLTWSRGLRSYRQQACEQLKAEAAAQREALQLVIAMPALIWDRYRTQRAAHAALAEAAEREGVPGVVAVLSRALGQWCVPLIESATREAQQALEQGTEVFAFPSIARQARERAPPAPSLWAVPQWPDV